jgi:uncharacterized glyoxalase superfamily protein PhnB
MMSSESNHETEPKKRHGRTDARKYTPAGIRLEFSVFKERYVRTNRSIPRATVIPELAYADVGEAARWLCETFGFTVRLRIANHRVQLNVGDGAIVVTELPAPGGGERDAAHSVMVRVENAHAHHEHARQHGARILRPPADYVYGERQYTVEDLGGHVWTFSESIADAAPEDWGGTSGQLEV